MYDNNSLNALAGQINDWGDNLFQNKPAETEIGNMTFRLLDAFTKGNQTVRNFSIVVRALLRLADIVLRGGYDVIGVAGAVAHKLETCLSMIERYLPDVLGDVKIIIDKLHQKDKNILKKLPKNGFCWALRRIDIDAINPDGSKAESSKFEIVRICTNEIFPDGSIMPLRIVKDGRILAKPQSKVAVKLPPDDPKKHRETKLVKNASYNVLPYIVVAVLDSIVSKVEHASDSTLKLTLKPEFLATKEFGPYVFCYSFYYETETLNNKPVPLFRYKDMADIFAGPGGVRNSLTAPEYARKFVELAGVKAHLTADNEIVVPKDARIFDDYGRSLSLSALKNPLSVHSFLPLVGDDSPLVFDLLRATGQSLNVFGKLNLFRYLNGKMKYTPKESYDFWMSASEASKLNLVKSNKDSYQK